MKKNVFTTSYRILLPVILAIALLAPKKPGQIAILILVDCISNFYCHASEKELHD